jgi:hypothetical protein
VSLPFSKLGNSQKVMAHTLADAILFSSSIEVIKSFFNGIDEEEKKQLVNARDAMGDTPLHLAAYKKKLYVVMMLLNHGADVNAQNNVLSPKYLCNLRIVVWQYSSSQSRTWWCRNGSGHLVGARRQVY